MALNGLTLYLYCFFTGDVFSWIRGCFQISLPADFPYLALSHIPKPVFFHLFGESRNLVFYLFVLRKLPFQEPYRNSPLFLNALGGETEGGGRKTDDGWQRETWGRLCFHAFLSFFRLPRFPYSACFSFAINPIFFFGLFSINNN